LGTAVYFHLIPKSHFILICRYSSVQWHNIIWTKKLRLLCLTHINKLVRVKMIHVFALILNVPKNHCLYIFTFWIIYYTFQLLMSTAENPVKLSIPQLLQEVIIGGAYASAQRNLPADAVPLVALLPLSTITHVSELEVKVSPPTLYIFNSLFSFWSHKTINKIYNICRSTVNWLKGDVHSLNH